MARSLLLVTFLSVNVAACSVPPDKWLSSLEARIASATAAENKAPPPAQARKAPQPAAKPARPAAPTAPAAPANEENAAQKSAAGPDPIGKSELELISLLGRPSAERPTGPGKMLHYATEGCAVDVLLFPDLQSGTLRALDMVESGRSGVSARECLGRIQLAFRSGK